MIIRSRFHPSVLHHLRRHCSSSQAALSTPASQINTWFDPWVSLGLTGSSLVQNDETLASLVQLPEVKETLEQERPTKQSVESLQRSMDIFSSMNPYGSEHLALQALLAETKHLLGDMAGSFRLLEDLEKHAPNNDSKETVLLACSKSLWLQGQLDESHALLEQAVQSASSPLASESIRTGQAILRMLQVSTLDDLFSIRDPFRGVVKSFERSSPQSLAFVTSLLNMGIAEVIYAQLLAEKRNLGKGEVPMDGALRSWKQGLTTLERHVRKKVRNSPYQSGVADALESRLCSNMSWALLERGLVEEASEYASQSLKIHDAKKCAIPLSSFAHSLGLVAQCFHRSGGAVTAEGLFQTAISETVAPHPLAALEARENLLKFAALYDDWDKREQDAARLRKKSEALEQALAPSWRGKLGSLSSFWFWLPAQV